MHAGDWIKSWSRMDGIECGWAKMREILRAPMMQMQKAGEAEMDLEWNGIV